MDGLLFDRETETLHAADGQSREGDAGAQSAAPARVPLPEYTQDVRRFYENQENEPFRNMVEGALSVLLEDRQFGATTRAVLANSFGNDRARMESTIKAQVYSFFTSTREADVSIRRGYRFTMTGEGPAMVVRPSRTDGPGMMEASRNIQSYVRQYVGSLQQRPAPAAQPAR